MGGSHEKARFAIGSKQPWDAQASRLGAGSWRSHSERKVLRQSWTSGDCRKARLRCTDVVGDFAIQDRALCRLFLRSSWHLRLYEHLESVPWHCWADVALLPWLWLLQDVC